MKDFELKNIDHEDLEDLLFEVEKSFGFQFEDNELLELKTFGEFCDIVKGKMKLQNVDDCTSQQAFYKLRLAISKTVEIEYQKITPSLLLTDLLPRKNRMSIVKNLDNHLGFNLKILRPPDWITILLLITFLSSLVLLAFNWRIAIIGIIVSISAFWISSKFGIELDVKTVGEVAQKITRENYLNSRRNKDSFNNNEIEKILVDWFSDHFDLEKSKLTREAQF